MGKQENKKIVTNRKSVHLVFFSCPDCGEEVEHIQFCSKCGQPMRVIDVVEKFGSEAEELIKKIKEESNVDIKDDDYVAIEETVSEEESPNIIVLGEDDHIEDSGSIEDDDDGFGLEEIYPDDEESPAPSTQKSVENLDDLVAALDEEDDGDLGLDDMGDGGLPEL